MVDTAIVGLHFLCPFGGGKVDRFSPGETGRNNLDCSLAVALLGQASQLEVKSQNSEGRKGPTGTEPEWENFPLPLLQLPELK